MSKQLRALVLGSGFAGQGHAMALRDCGVEVAGMASRTEDVVKRVAAEMRIPYASTDWRRALVELRPDVVAVGTPGGPHYEMCRASLEAGRHIFCDKPLATTAVEARDLYLKARQAGVKTAYAASFYYQPHAIFSRELVQGGAIGAVYEVECVSHYNRPPLAPYGWPHSLKEGGGRLNNNFTHKLAIVCKALDGAPLAVAGETRNDLKRAPVGPHVHDFRQLADAAFTPEQAEKAEWRESDADWSYTVLARIGKPGSDWREAATATFRHSALHNAYVKDYVAFYGERGTIHIEGSYAQGPLRLWRRDENKWKTLAVPERITKSLPAIENDTQRNWTQMLREFVADINGEGYSGYLTFRDGWIHQTVIDMVRESAGWHQVPQEA